MSKLKIRNTDGTFSEVATKNYVDSQLENAGGGATYSLSKSGSTITLTGSDGSTSSVTDADTNTTYDVVSTSANGLCPKRGGTTTKFLRDDGTWAVPPDTNTTYSAATTSASGLMSSSDKTKLNGIATGAQVNNVVVSTSQPTASTAQVWINPNGQTTISNLQTQITNISAKLPTTIYSGTLTGGNSVTLSGVKRFLKVYCKVNFAQGPGILSFEIDTSNGSTPCGGAMLDPFDETGFNSIYSFAGKYTVSNKTFTLYRVGYYVFSSHSWAERHGNASYFCYRIDTYD